MSPNPIAKAVFSLWLLGVVQLLFGTFPALADPRAVIKDLDTAFVAIADKVKPAVVFIETDDSTGSGFIISPDGLIMTNAHVVGDAEEVAITLFSQEEYSGKLLGLDRDTDLALIKIDAKGLPTLTLSDSSKLRVGEIVVAIGNPAQQRWTVTSGIVSATGRTGRGAGVATYTDYIQTDAAINYGNSGGPLVNILGEVVGVNSWIIPPRLERLRGGEIVDIREFHSLGFAVPANSAKWVKDEIMKRGRVDRGYLGIDGFQDLTKLLARAYNRLDRRGVFVTSVVGGSPAAGAGIKPGDIILSYDERSLENSDQFRIFTGQARPGETAKLAIFRNGRTADVTVTFAEQSIKGLTILKRGETRR